MDISIFLNLAKLYKENGYRLFMVGSASRDFLLKNEIEDFDLVSDATPEESATFLTNLDTSFAKYGIIRIKGIKEEVTIATLRKEEDYVDYRHPKRVIYVKSLEEDAKRRDFTINAIYIDDKLNIYDFYNGVDDLLNGKIIKMIGDVKKRISEDPLRILRAIRFANKLQLTLSKTLLNEIYLNYPLISKLNKEKIALEIKKVNHTI